ncbi:GtrA family protein [Enterobacter cloacae]|uniref:GtrA family protein n=1 Tax=Enterobacter cloacae TaxID=550 RepID=UPI0038909EEF
MPENTTRYGETYPKSDLFNKASLLLNFAGYVVGVLFSFILNTVFTFSSKPSATKLLKFLTCCGVCYAINLFTMNIAMLSGAENVYFVQLTGMFFYTVSGFIINKLWVMK